MDLAVALPACDRRAIVGQGHGLRGGETGESRLAELAAVTVAIGVERPTSFPGVDCACQFCRVGDRALDLFDDGIGTAVCELDPGFCQPRRRALEGTFTDVNGKTIDLNGDGIADFVGMGPKGLVFAYGNTSGSGGAYGLGALQSAQISGTADDLGEAQGWTDATTVRDIVYDAKTGFDDIIAFGAAGVYVSMGQDPSTHSGQPFGQLYLGMADFGSNQGWSVGMTPRLVGDVTGDGIPDIVGFGDNSTFVAVGSRDSSNNLSFKLDPTKTIGDFGAAEGWSGKDLQTLRALGNVTGAGSGHSDLILSGAFNTQVWHFT